MHSYYIHTVCCKRVFLRGVPAPVVHTASTRRQSSPTFDFSRQRQIYNTAAIRTDQPHLVGIAGIGEINSDHNCSVLLLSAGFCTVLYLKIWKLSPSASNFECLSLSPSVLSLWCGPAALSFDRQVWECEQTALEGDRQWPQTVSLLACSAGACSECLRPQTAKRVAPCQSSSALFEKLLRLNWDGRGRFA